MVPPRRRDASLPRGLEAICLKALAVRAEDRYPSARALADDVTRWLADEPVTAWREPVSIRTRRWARRHRTAVAVVAAAAGGRRDRAGGRCRRTGPGQRPAPASQRRDPHGPGPVGGVAEASRGGEHVPCRGVPQPRPIPGRPAGESGRCPGPSQRSARPGIRGIAGDPGALLDALGETYLGLGLYDQAVSRYTRPGPCARPR